SGSARTRGRSSATAAGKSAWRGGGAMSRATPSQSPIVAIRLRTLSARSRALFVRIPGSSGVLGTAHTDVEEAERGRVIVSDGRRHAARVVDERPAALDLIDSRGRPRGTVADLVPVVVVAEPVRRPLAHVAEDVVEAVGVRQEPPDRGRARQLALRQHDDLRVPVEPRVVAERLGTPVDAS